MTSEDPSSYHPDIRCAKCDEFLTIRVSGATAKNPNRYFYAHDKLMCTGGGWFGFARGLEFDELPDGTHKPNSRSLFKRNAAAPADGAPPSKLSRIEAYASPPCQHTIDECFEKLVALEKKVDFICASFRTST